MKYSPSIMHQPDGACYICGRTDQVLYCLAKNKRAGRFHNGYV